MANRVVQPQQIPVELLLAHIGQQVQVNIADHRSRLLAELEAKRARLRELHARRLDLESRETASLPAEPPPLPMPEPDLFEAEEIGDAAGSTFENPDLFGLSDDWEAEPAGQGEVEEIGTGGDDWTASGDDWISAVKVEQLSPPASDASLPLRDEAEEIGTWGGDDWAADDWTDLPHPAANEADSGSKPATDWAADDWTDLPRPAANEVGGRIPPTTQAQTLDPDTLLDDDDLDLDAIVNQINQIETKGPAK